LTANAIDAEADQGEKAELALAALTLGAVADAVDLETALLCTAIGPALALFVSMFLPPAPARRLVEPAPATI